MQNEDFNPQGQNEEMDADDVRDQVDQDPGERQRENQNHEKDDPLAA
jgi:hypothetical protein